MERNLSGCVVIVTGAAEGIGFAIAQRLAAAGAQVAVADVDEAGAYRATEKLRANDYAAAAVSVDISDEGSVHDMVEQVKRELGVPEILVNNAGVTGGSHEVWELDTDTWKQVIAVNLTVVFLCCHFVVPEMLSLGRGHIVNVASIAGKEGNPRLSAYSASKAGVIGFTKALAKEVAQQHIYVNAISPAVIQTRILDQMAPETVQYMVDRIPMGRVGQPEEVAALVHWLASDDCSFTTGQCLDISGGRATY